MSSELRTATVVLVPSRHDRRRPWMWREGRWSRPDWAVIEHGDRVEVTMMGDTGWRYINGRRPTFVGFSTGHRFRAEGDYGELPRVSGRTVYWFSRLVEVTNR